MAKLREGYDIRNVPGLENTELMVFAMLLERLSLNLHATGFADYRGCHSESIETASISSYTDGSVDPTAGPNNPTIHVHHEAWYDIEDGCFVFDDLPEENSFTPALVLGDYSLPRVSHGASSQHSDENAWCKSQEPDPDGLSQSKRKDSKHDGGEDELELEKDIKLIKLRVAAKQLAHKDVDEHV